MKYVKACMIFLAFLLGFGCAQLFGAPLSELPQDSGKWHLSIVGDGNDLRYTEIASWFQNHEGLKQLREQTHYHVVTTDSQEYAAYKSSTQRLPLVRLQLPHGQRYCTGKACTNVVYEKSDSEIPKSADVLYASLIGRVKAVSATIKAGLPGVKPLQAESPAVPDLKIEVPQLPASPAVAAPEFQRDTTVDLYPIFYHLLSIVGGFLLAKYPFVGQLLITLGKYMGANVPQATASKRRSGSVGG